MRIFSSKMLLNSGMFVVEFPCGPQKSSKSQSILEDVDFLSGVKVLARIDTVRLTSFPTAA